MFEAIGYEVHYREGFIERAFDNWYHGTETYIEWTPLLTAIHRAQNSVLGLCEHSAVTLTEIDTLSGSQLVTGFHILVIVRKDEHQVENLERALACFERSLDWEEYQDGPYVTLNRDYRTVEWHVNPPSPQLAE